MKNMPFKFRRYANSDDGSLSIEAVLVAPLVFFGLMMTYSYFAAFQAKGQANKAAYTVADYISRQTDAVDADFMEGLEQIYSFLTFTDADELRVSSVMWIEDEDTEEAGDGDYFLEWSYATDGGDSLTDETLSEIEPRLAIMSNGETVVVVETTTSWTPILNVGLTTLAFENTVITKPRFATQVVFDTGEDTGSSYYTSSEDDDNEESDPGI